jgi:hypothetical protein
MSLGIEVLASAQTAASIDSVLKREDGKFMLNGNDQIVAVQELLGAKRPMGRTIFAQSFVSGAN